MVYARKTKIICTLGPATDKPGVLESLVKSGMNVARINFSHQDHDTHLRRIEQLKKIRKEQGVPIALLADTKGPEIRLGQIPDGPVTLKAGQTFILSTKEEDGDATRASISYADLPSDLKKGDTILIDDGLVEMEVTAITGTEISCMVKNDGEISSNKGVNVPGVELSIPYISSRDRSDIRFAVNQDFDFIAASFTRNAQDILMIRRSWIGWAARI